MKNRAGEFINNLTGDLSYQSFNPAPLPPNPHLAINNEILSKTILANKKISYLNGISSRIPNINLFISMYIRKEALLSSQIEGTQCTIDDIFNPLNEDNQNNDVGDVLNYIKATELALNELNKLPLCNRLLKETHKILLSNVRGQEKNPGEFRNSQNWIGGQGSTIKNARYIPPKVDDMITAMSDLEKYINNDERLDPLIQIALIHYQFETIHPFLDGNGRIGRLLITLFLINKKILQSPTLYISYFLKVNQIEYYDRMSQVRKTGDYEQWVEFFLDALIESSEDAIEAINKLSLLHENNYQKIINNVSTRQVKNVLKLFNYIESSPIIDIGKSAKALSLSFNTIFSAIKVLQNFGILTENKKVGREKTYSYEAYLEILRKDTY